MNLAPLFLVSGLCLLFTLAVFFLRERLQTAHQAHRSEVRPRALPEDRD